MKPPEHDRNVLTWVKDSGGLEYWQIDSYFRSKHDSSEYFYTAYVWEQEVLYWQELPKPPDKEI